MQDLTLPPTVVATHLRSCAEELAAGLRCGGPGATTAELTDVVAHLIASQEAISHALAGLAARVEGGGAHALAAAPPLDVEVVAEVFREAAIAARCTAEALGEVTPSFECVSESVAPDTRL
ncbi:hypothetical protein AB0M83_10780 [Amycolatopsis sp. NPDC051106]|jgi:hypothetical protein|uniref:hypothetical protein n=1 Tax=unclassified Amycolatopsis TaxID=2618356 RepID=UPI003414BA22